MGESLRRTALESLPLGSNAGKELAAEKIKHWVCMQSLWHSAL